MRYTISLFSMYVLWVPLPLNAWADIAPNPSMFESYTHDSSSPLSRLEVRRAINSQAPIYRSCYEIYRHGHPTLRGFVMVKFLVASSGRVLKVQIRRSTFDASVNDCMQRFLYSLKFPQFKGAQSTTIFYPFRFLPSPRNQPPQ